MKKNYTSTALQNLSLYASKENQIDNLKQEVFQLKDMEYELFKLNDQIANIQSKYSLVLNERGRNQGLFMTKINISKSNAQELQADIDSIQDRINETSVDLQNLVRDNCTLQRNCENKENEIVNLSITLKQVEKANQSKLIQLKIAEESLLKIKQQKCKMQQQCQKLSKRLADSQDASKQLQKEIRNQMIVQKSLENSLSHLRVEGDRMMNQMKVRQVCLREASEQFEKLSTQAKQTKQANLKLERERKSMQDQLNQLTKGLQKSQKYNEEKSVRLKELESLMLKSEQQLNKRVLKRETLMQQHSNLATQNKDLNLDIDDCLMRILYLQNINKTLQKNIQSYISCDEEARMLLDRKQKMSDLLQQIGSKLTKTQSAIAHLI